MKMKQMKKSLSYFLCMMLIVAMALFTNGCGDNKKNETGDDVKTEQNAPAGEKQVLGEGETVFDFTVVHQEGEEKQYEIHTDKSTVGEALVELGLIAGDQGDYGLYVKTVDGETLDYDTDGKYWAFYENGEYGMTGVDLTEIKEGVSYAFKAEK